MGEDTAGQPAAPGVLTPGQEEEFLVDWVLEELEGLRRDFPAYGFGKDGLDFVAWRKDDGRGDPVKARDPGELREFLTARRPS